MTLSQLPSALPVFASSSILDRAEGVDLPVLIRNIAFVGEALAHYIYNHQNLVVEVCEPCFVGSTVSSK